MRKLFVHIQVWQQVLIFLIMVALATLLAGCNSNQPGKSVWKPPSAFQAADLIGEWKVVSEVYPVDETLLLNSDGSFIHNYQIPNATPPYSEQGHWWIEQRASGCVFLHLEGMRYFQSTLEVANSGNGALTGTLIRFEEPCEQTTFEMPDKVIMTVGSLPQYPKNLTLFFPRTSIEGPYVTMKLHNMIAPTTITPVFLPF
jgi:hypothetical protein